MSAEWIENNNNESNGTIKTIISTCSITHDDKRDSVWDKTRSGIRSGTQDSSALPDKWKIYHVSI